MKQEELQTILNKHNLWLNDEEGGERANLTGANLTGDDFDYASWPLWYGSLKAHVDNRLAIQLLYHTLSVVMYSPNVTPDIKKDLLTEANLKVANQFHRVEECGKLRIKISSI